MSKKREILFDDAKIEKVNVFTNDKGQEFCQVVVNIRGRLFYYMDFKSNDALLLEVYKQERSIK